MAAFPRIYRSFAEFERDELRKLDGIHLSIDEMLEDMFPSEEHKQDEQKGGGK
jgi:hypothetical protein